MTRLPIKALSPLFALVFLASCGGGSEGTGIGMIPDIPGTSLEGLDSCEPQFSGQSLLCGSVTTDDGVTPVAGVEVRLESDTSSSSSRSSISSRGIANEGQCLTDSKGEYACVLPPDVSGTRTFSLTAPSFDVTTFQVDVQVGAINTVQPQVLISESVSVFEYINFSSPSNLNIQGDATPDLANGIDSDSVLRLTSSVGDFQTGTTYHTNAVPLETFDVEFSFRITDSNGFIDRLDETGGDGFALIFQAIGDAVGASGGALGYGGISPSVAIEIDTYFNSNDPDSNHVGVNINGDTSSTNNSVFVEPRFDDENQWYAWIDYDQPILEIRFAQVDQRPDEVTLTMTVDIPSIIGLSTGFVGFTSATGQAHSNHDILNWSYRSDQ